ncbi:MAG: ribonuclease P protein component [Proteobacteria bacterium]|nr:ribonuclease P protein component [Pseudomonadota bacterium]
MLPRLLRLRQNKDIRTTIQRGPRLYSSPVRIHYLIQPAQQHFRVATVVSKKVNSSSVRRHRYQRWLRQIARETISALPQSYDMVWVATPKMDQIKSLAELRHSLAPILKKLR